MKPNRVGQRFWVPHSSHCVTISALPAPPHFSCQEGQQKGGGWGDEGGQGGMGKKSSDWLLYTLADKGLVSRGRLKSLSAYNKSLSVFQFGKTFSSSNWEKNSSCPTAVFPDFKSEKAWPGFPCVAGRGTFGRYQHNEVVMGRQKRAPRIEGQVPWYANDAKSGPAGWRPQ